MADQGDLQELLRMLTSRKVSMLAAMGHVKSLQASRLLSIQEIAAADLAQVEAALGDVKLAKSLHTACKTHAKKGTKRTASESATSPSAKKPKLEPHKRDLDYSAMTSDELEGSLDLPLDEDEDAIRATAVVTNRAPLLLAFAVELLRLTMPEQPPSSRLSLAQAVVSANSRAKAVSLGIEKASATGAGIDEQQIPESQPTVRVMGRDVPVLKRGGYTWVPAGESGGGGEAGSSTTGKTDEADAANIPPDVASTIEVTRQRPDQRKAWTASQRLTSKSSVFIAHAASLSSSSQRGELVKRLMTEKPHLETATHNAWAARTSYGASPLVQEASFDDGETGWGAFMLGLMREAGVKNTVVVLTRWFGGVMLGPDRWRLMRECVEGALLAQRQTWSLSGEALWALDQQDDKKPATTTVGMAIHRPEGARNYLLRSFKSGERDGGGGKKTATAAGEDAQVTLGRVLGAIRLLLTSWHGVLGARELDRRAWGWYARVRPDVDAGKAGWGAKGTVKLADVLDLRRSVDEVGVAQGATEAA